MEVKMFKKSSIVFFTLMFITFFSVSTTLAKNDKPKHEKNTPNKSERALEQQEMNAQKTEKEEGSKGPSKQAGNSDVAHLYLYEKTPDPDPEATREDPWLIVEGGMWGKMKYYVEGSFFDFVFNGHGLPIGVDYTLIYYPDPWPGEGLICLGSGTVAACDEEDEEEECEGGGSGNIHIKGSVDTGSFPIESDENYPGAKIFLVPSDDVDCEGQIMVGWTGDDANLYEGALISFFDTDGIAEPELEE
jgi:hypothetical protein